MEKLKPICLFYSYWVVIDDQFFDNSLDLDDIVRKAEAFLAGLNEQPGVDKVFQPMVEFCSKANWTDEAKEIFKRETKRYLENMIRQRAIEVHKEEVSIEEYLECRAFDVAMPVIFSLLWYTQDDMPLPAYYNAAFEKAFKCSGLSIGILLDVHSYRARKEELSRLEAQYPGPVHYFRYLQSGTIQYCNENRKIRYLQDFEPDENPVGGRSIV